MKIPLIKLITLITCAALSASLVVVVTSESSALMQAWKAKKEAKAESYVVSSQSAVPLNNPETETTFVKEESTVQVIIEKEPVTEETLQVVEVLPEEFEETQPVIIVVNNDVNNKPVQKEEKPQPEKPSVKPDGPGEAITPTEPDVDEPIEVHTHSFAMEVAEDEYLKSPATCTESAIYFKSCECGLSSEGQADEAIFAFGDANGHSFNAEWTITDSVHYHKASCGCDVVPEECDDYGEHDTDGENGACSVCGYFVSENPEEIEDEIPAQPDLSGGHFSGTIYVTPDSNWVIDPITGLLIRSGFITVGEGSWEIAADGYHYFRETNGGLLIGWQFIDGKWYYMNSRSGSRYGACLVGPGISY